jgi:hypothetical protein
MFLLRFLLGVVQGDCFAVVYKGRAVFDEDFAVCAMLKADFRCVVVSCYRCQSLVLPATRYAI